MLIATILGVLSALLNLFSSHYTFHQHGQPITKTLLSPQWMRRLNALVKGAYSDLTLVVLKLLNAISAFGGGRDRAKLRDSFAWDAKVLFHCIGLYLLLISYLQDALKAASYAAEIESATQGERSPEPRLVFSSHRSSRTLSINYIRYPHFVPPPCPVVRRRR
jgi:hypothetical protein